MIQVAITFIQTHAPFLPPFPQPPSFYFFFPVCVRKSPLPRKMRMKNLVGMIPFAGDEPLGMSLAHREPNTQALYVAV